MPSTPNQVDLLFSNQKNTYNLKTMRFVRYCQRVVKIGDFLKVYTLLERFLKSTKSNVSDRQQKRYIAYLKKHAPDFSLYVAKTLLIKTRYTSSIPAPL